MANKKNRFLVNGDSLTIRHHGDVHYHSATVVREALLYGKQLKGGQPTTRATAAINYIMQRIAAGKNGFVFKLPLWKHLSGKDGARTTNPELVAAFAPLHKYFQEVFEAEAVSKHKERKFAA